MSFELVAGLKADQIDLVSDRLRAVLGADYERRASEYRGEYNRFPCPEWLVVKYNFVPYEDEWDEPESKQFAVLVSVAETDRPQFFRDIIDKLGMEAQIIRCREWNAAT